MCSAWAESKEELAMVSSVSRHLLKGVGPSSAVDGRLLSWSKTDLWFLLLPSMLSDRHLNIILAREFWVAQGSVQLKAASSMSRRGMAR